MATARIGAAGAAPDLEREADELEAALADQLLHSDEPLDVRKAHVAADVMNLEIVAPRSARAHAFDPEHLDLLAAEPAGGFLRQPREVRQIPLRPVAASMKIHVQQHHVVRLDLDAGGRFRLFEICNRDV